MAKVIKTTVRPANLPPLKSERRKIYEGYDAEQVRHEINHNFKELLDVPYMYGMHAEAADLQLETVVSANSGEWTTIPFNVTTPNTSSCVWNEEKTEFTAYQKLYGDTGANDSGFWITNASVGFANAFKIGGTPVDLNPHIRMVSIDQTGDAILPWLSYATNYSMFDPDCLPSNNPDSLEDIEKFSVVQVQLQDGWKPLATFNDPDVPQMQRIRVWHNATQGVSKTPVALPIVNFWPLCPKIERVRICNYYHTPTP